MLEAAGAEGGKAVRPARAKRRREGSDEDEDEKPEGPVLRVTLKASKQALVPGRRAAKKAEPAQPQEFALGSTVCSSARPSRRLAFEHLGGTEAHSPRVQVRGYVKSVGKQGAFVEVAPGTDARVKLSQLADTFLDAPSEAFPVGKLVRGRIVGNAHGRRALLAAVPASPRIRARICRTQYGNGWRHATPQAPIRAGWR